MNWNIKRLTHAIAISMLLMPSIAYAGDRVIGGRVSKLRDVNTTVVAGRPVDLKGLENPEVSIRAGKDAAPFMRRLVGGKIVTCELNGERTYDRWGEAFVFLMVRRSRHSQQNCPNCPAIPQAHGLLPPVAPASEGVQPP